MEDVYAAGVAEDRFGSISELLDPLPIFLLDGSSGTPACLIDCFVSNHRTRTPTPPAYPVELLVNSAIVGSDQAAAVYPQATVRCDRLVTFLDAPVIEAADAVGRVTSTVERARAVGPDWSLSIAERVKTQETRASLTMNWSSSLSIEGRERPLSDWARSLNDGLCLFAVLVDQPLTPDQIYAGDRSGVDLYASWSDRSGPDRTVPLITLGQLGGEFQDIVRNWFRLTSEARDFVDHLVEFQLHRHRQTLPDQVLLLLRALELYHASSGHFSTRIRPRSEHRRLVDLIVEALSPELRPEHGEWVRGSLAEANRKRLAVQITDVLTHLGSTVLAVCHVADAAAFSAVARATRNYYTHPSGQVPPNVPTGRDLLVLVQRLWFVARACLLTELGLSEAQTADALRRSALSHYVLE